MRGDSNADRTLDLADPVDTLAFLFRDSDAPMCPDASGANDDGRLDLSDPVVTLIFLFHSPTGEREREIGWCVRDPTEDQLGFCGVRGCP